MGRFLAGVLLLLAALFSGYGAVLGLSVDLNAVTGDRNLVYIHRTLEPGLLAILAAAVLNGVAGLMLWGGARAWRSWTVLGLTIAVLTIVAWSILLGTSATLASAYAGAGLVLALASALIVLGLLALVIAPRASATLRGTAAVCIFAAVAVAAPPEASAQSCPDGCVAVPGTPVSVTECFLFVFCDTYTLTPFDCMDANDTSAPCPADQQQPPPDDDEGDEQLVFVCPGNLGSGDPNATVVVYDFTCQVIYRIVDSLLREWG